MEWLCRNCCLMAHLVGGWGNEVWIGMEFSIPYSTLSQSKRLTPYQGWGGEGGGPGGGLWSIWPRHWVRQSSTKKITENSSDFEALYLLPHTGRGGRAPWWPSYLELVSNWSRHSLEGPGSNPTWGHYMQCSSLLITIIQWPEVPAA